MEQLTLFAPKGQSRGLPVEVLDYRPEIIKEPLGYQLMDRLVAQAPWQQKVVSMYDKQVITPRLTAWYANAETMDYTSLRKSAPNDWTPELLYIKDLLEPLAGVEFNSVLLNYYRDGNDSVAWHSDNERALGENPTIASISFGQVRPFEIRKKDNHQERYSVLLEHGSLLLMKGSLQSQ
ncbi:alpha-ketoglutarate-dependent dioxygenase AlkB family protein [Pedobacter sp. PWIIR3]